MKRFTEGESRTQVTLLPECLDDYITKKHPVRVVDVFVDELDLGALGFEGVDPAATGRPAYHPAVLLKICIYGYLNRIQSSRRLEREAERNVELMWLTGRLVPESKTIAGFRRDNGKAIRSVCRQFVVLCRNLNLLSQSIIAIDGSKFKAVNNRDRNFTQGKIKARMQQIEQSIDRALAAMGSADRAALEVAGAKAERLSEKIEKLKQQMTKLKDIEAEAITVEAVQIRLEHNPGKMKVRRQTVEHPFGTLKSPDLTNAFPITGTARQPPVLIETTCPIDGRIPCTGSLSNAGAYALMPIYHSNNRRLDALSV